MIIIPTYSPPENLGRSAEVNGTVRGLGVHPLAEEAQVLHLLADETAREADFLAADNDDPLAVQELLGQNRGQAAEHVVPGVYHHSLRADP